MASGKSKKGRGGSSSRSRRETSGKRISSISSTAVRATNSSPPSVTRRPLPPQYSDGQHNETNVRQPTRFSPSSSMSPPQPQASRSQASSQRRGNELGGLQQPEASGDRVQQTHQLNQLQDFDDSEPDPEFSEHESDSSSDDEAAQHQQNAADLYTLNQLLSVPGRDEFLPRLSPTPGQGLWFTRNKNVLTNKIAKLLQDKFDGLWYSWSVTPTHAKDMYFIQFAHRYTWDPVLTPEVRDHFEKVCKSRLKGMVNYVRTRRKRPSWIMGKHWKKMEDHWETENAIKRSKKASKARMSERGGLGPHKHVGGPKSNAQHQAEMSAEQGREVSIGEVFIKTHTRKDGTYVDEKARQIGESYQHQIQATQSDLDVDLSMASDGASRTPVLTKQQLDELFLKTTTFDSRGRPYGLGSLSQGYTKGKTNHSLPSSSAITALEEKLKETETKLAQQVEQNKAQMDFVMKYLQTKDPALPDWVVSAPAPEDLPQDPNLNNSQQQQDTVN